MSQVIGKILDQRGDVLFFVRMQPERRMGYQATSKAMAAASDD
jgi:hypothetical protein